MRALDRLSEDVLLKLYECSAIHSQGTWSFESAFRALELSTDAEEQKRVFDALIRRGYIVADGAFLTKLKEEDGFVRVVSDTGVRLTAAGNQAAVQIQIDREPKSFIVRLHSLQWATWGGLAAIIAALASSVAAYFAYIAVK